MVIDQLIVLAYIIIGTLVVVVGGHYNWWRNRKECKRLCITLKNNEGVFIALCVEKTSKRWTFENGQTVGQKSTPILGRIHVPYRNILYYQELPNVVE